MQQFTGVRTNRLPYTMPVMRPPLQRLQNEHVERSLQKLDSVFIPAGDSHGCRQSTTTDGLEVSTLLSCRNIKRSERQAIVADTLDRFQIVAKKDLYPNQLSGGQQQLVGVARAIIAKPKLILADEPTGNLHSSQGKEIMELFKTLNAQGTTIVQVTHSELNASYGNKVINLFDGWLNDSAVSA